VEVIGDGKLDEVPLHGEQLRGQGNEQPIGGVSAQLLQNAPDLALRLADEVRLVGEDLAPGEGGVDREQPRDGGGEQPEADQGLERDQDPQRAARRHDVAEAQGRKVTSER
jgi:hypothetical protein